MTRPRIVGEQVAQWLDCAAVPTRNGIFPAAHGSMVGGA